MPRPPLTTVYKARDGYRWHAKAANGNTVAESGEAYALRAKLAAIRDRLRGVKTYLTAALMLCGAVGAYLHGDVDGFTAFSRGCDAAAVAFLRAGVAKQQGN